MTAPRLRAVWLLALALMCACRASPARPPPAAPAPASAPAEPALPEEFGPLGWRTTAQSLRERFPEATVTESEPYTVERDGRPLVVVGLHAWGAHLEPFGKVEIDVMGFQGQPAAVIVIHRSDSPADECYPKGSTEAQQDACRARLERERSAVYEPIAARFIARYGPGKRGHLSSEAELTDEERAELDDLDLIWELPGLELRLATGPDPRYHQPMMVRLVAVRDNRYNY